MPKPDIFELRSSICDLNELMVHLGRYCSLLTLAAGDYRDKCSHAAKAYQIFELAHAIEEHLFRYVQVRPRTIGWWPDLHPTKNGVLRNGILYHACLKRLVEKITREISFLIQSNLSKLENVAVLEPWILILQRARSLIDYANDGQRNLSSVESAHSQNLSKAVTGPKHSPLARPFKRTYSLRQYRSPEFSEHIGELTAYFWTLSIREAMACDSCVLSVCEYDGLPLQFYRDLAKQAWDEARHANMVFDLSKELMVEVMKSTDHKDLRVQKIVSEYLNDDNYLPVPREGNLYEAMWPATLAERLILMQIQTEGRAVGNLRRRIRSTISSRFLSIRHALEIDQRDEVSHVMIGRRWLTYLVPCLSERRSMLECTSLLRGVMISAAISVYGDGTVAGVLDSMLPSSIRTQPLPKYF